MASTLRRDSTVHPSLVEGPAERQGRAWLPLGIAIACYAWLLGWNLGRILAATSGTQPYLLDDTYIHLAIAKNLLAHGVYGIASSESAMACSSILWPLLLVGFGRLFGLSLWLPLVLNVVLSLVFIALAAHILRRAHIASVAWQTFTLVLLVLGFPLVAMTLDGMEHVLYGCAFLLFLWLSAEVLAGDARAGMWLPVGAAFATSCRYEGVFPVLVVALLLVSGRKPRWLLAVVTGLAAALPPLLFGLFSRAHGGMWVPNSLVMKTLDGGSGAMRVLHLFVALADRYSWTCGLAGLLMLLAWLVYVGRSATRRFPLDRPMLLIVLGSALLHLEFARLRSNTPRYESYLVGTALLVACIAAAHLLEKSSPGQAGPRRLSLAGIGVLVLLVLAPVLLFRGLWWGVAPREAALSIYRQQFQAAQFFRTYYDGRPMMANDVGAISFFSDVQTFDLWGLGNNQVAQLWARGAFDTAAIARLTAAHGVKVGFLYGGSFTGQQALPAGWIYVGSWASPHPRGSTAGAQIDFVATDPEAARQLLAHLKEFAPRLPAADAPSYHLQ